MSAGGFIGTTSKNTNMSLKFTNNVNEKEVVGTDSGGFIGRLLDFAFVSFVHCQSDTSIEDVDCYGCSHGGLIGLVQNQDSTNTKPTLSINDCSCNQIASLSGQSRSSGGFIGKVNNTINTTVSLYHVETNGQISTKSTLYPYFIGGLIGSVIFNNDGLILSIKNSVNNISFLSNGESQIGGIVGSFSSGISDIVSFNIVNTTNMGNINSNGNVIAGGMIGYLSNTKSFMMVDCKNDGKTVVNGVNNDVGGLVGLLQNDLNFIQTPNIIIKDCINNGIITSSSSKIINAGGLFGSILNNSDIVFSMNGCFNTASMEINATGTSCVGGLVGKANGNLLSAVHLSDCENNGTIVVVGQQVNAGGLVGLLASNSFSNILISSSRNNGIVNLVSTSLRSNIGGMIGLIEQSPSNSVFLDNVINSMDVGSCKNCMSNNAGLVGMIQIDSKSTSFSVSITNSINQGTVFSSINGAIACGLFCVSSTSFSQQVVIQVTNSINNGTVSGYKSYGLGNGASKAHNVVSMGNVTSGISFFGSCNNGLFWFILKEFDSDLINATPFLKENDMYKTEDGQFVDDALNKNAVAEQYGMVWSRSLKLTRGLHITLGQPVNRIFVVAKNTDVSVIETLAGNVIASEKLHFVDKTSETEFESSKIFDGDAQLVLCHKVEFNKEYENVAFVEYHNQLHTLFPTIPDKYLSGKYSLRDPTESTKLYNKNSVIQSDTKMDVVAICHVMNKTECSEAKSCVQIGGCSEKSMAIPLVVVSVFAGLILIGAILFVVLIKTNKQKKNHPEEEGNTGENEMHKIKGNNKTVTVPIFGEEKVLKLKEEIGRGTYGTVWRAQAHDDNTVFAVKIQNGEFSTEEQNPNHGQLDTQFVVAVYGCGFKDNTMAIAMEYFALGSLQDVLQKALLPSNARVPMLLDIAKAMTYLHTNGIIHHNLKPGNVLVCSVDPNLHPMSKFVSFFIHHRQMSRHVTICNMQDIGLWRSNFNRKQHLHNERNWHAILHGTRNGNRQ